MPLNFKQAILRTVIYADIFDYPLKADEVRKWLIEVRIKNNELKVENIQYLNYKDNYYFLNKRENLVIQRKERKRWSEEKIKQLEKIIPLFKLIPTIKMVGVSGALAMENAKEDDDIDLMIITGKDRIWITRLVITFLLDILGRRRRPDELNVNNKTCLNMFIDEVHLSIPSRERDLFSAHEVLQVKPIFDRDGYYNSFVKANEWVKKYLPNAYPGIVNNKSRIKEKRNNWLNTIEKIFKRFQLWYMKNKRTGEVISDGIIRFHPRDARIKVLSEYKYRIKLFGNI